MNSMEKFDFVDKNLILNMDEQAVIQLTCSRHAVRMLMELLARLKNLGDAGCSRNISIEGSDKAMFFDGDGSDHIYATTLNGRSLEDWVFKQEQRNARRASYRSFAAMGHAEEVSIKPAIDFYPPEDRVEPAPEHAPVRSIAEDEHSAEVQDLIEQARDIQDRMDCEEDEPPAG